MDWPNNNKDDGNGRYPSKNPSNPLSSRPTPDGVGSDSPSAATQATTDTSHASHSQPPSTALRPRQLESTRLSEITARDRLSVNQNLRRPRQNLSANLPYLRIIVALSSTSVASLAFLIYILLPGPALIALLVWLASVLATLYAIWLSALDWWDDLQRWGLGRYLPESAIRLLTHESIHSFMTDDTFMLENRHMLLYFLPISPPQLERYVQRLAPRHRHRLQRRGLGHLVGENFMRFLLGEEQWYDMQRSDQRRTGRRDADPPLLLLPGSGDAGDEGGSHLEPNQPALEVLVESTSRRRLDQDSDNDDESDLGIDLSADDLAGGLSDERARQISAALTFDSPAVTEAELSHPRPQRLFSPHRASVAGIQETITSPSPDAVAVPAVDAHSMATDSTDDDHALSLAEEYAEEELVLTQAVINAVYDGFWTPLSRYWVAAAEETAGPVTARLVTYGLGISAVSTVLGLLLGMVGYRRGIYRRPTLMQAYPRENTLYTTVMLGLAGTGVTLLAHWHMRRGEGGRTQFYSQFRRASKKG